MIAPLVSLVLVLATASPALVHAWAPHDTAGRRVTPNLRARSEAIGLRYDFTQLVAIDYPGDAIDVTSTDLLYTADGNLVLGWHEKAIELCGGKRAHATEPICRAKGGALCEYLCEWE